MDEGEFNELWLDYEDGEIDEEEFNKELMGYYPSGDAFEDGIPF